MTAPPSAAWGEVRRLLRRGSRPIAGALVLVALSRVAAMGLPAASRYVVDEVIGRQRHDRLGAVALLAAAAVAVEAAAVFAAVQLAGVAGQRTVAALRRELHARVLMLPVERVDAGPGGALAARITADTDQVRYLAGSGLVQLVASALTASLALGLLFALHPTLTLLVLAVVGLAGLAVGRSFRRVTLRLQGVLCRQSELAGVLAEVLGGIRLVKACAAERREAARLAILSHGLVRESVRAIRGISLLHAGNTLAAGSLGVVLLVVAGRAVPAGDMTLGSYVMFAWLTGLVLGPVMHVAGGAGELGKALAAAGRIAELRGLRTEEEEEGPRIRLAGMAGTVDFEGVSYWYAPGRPALHAVTFHAPAGSTIALVGPNGSGKTTLCRLLLAHYRPALGRILIDGHDLATLHRRSHRSRLGVVLQEDLLFDGTIADNIRYGRPGASMAEMRRAAQSAQCDLFIRHLPDGYATRVGERGLRLSAGQRQRVAIARAFLADPRILVLDEATSHLDPESEALIQDALELLCEGRTAFVIAHRLSTVRRADQILLMERGSIVERGIHQTLVARSGRYAGALGLAEPAGGNGRDH